MLTSPKAMLKAQMMGISVDHFIHTDEGNEMSYTRNLYGVIDDYFDRSGGSLVTPTVLDLRMIEKGVRGKHRAKFVTLWEQVQEEDYDENELYELLMQLKQAKALRVLTEMFTGGHSTLVKDGIEKCAEYVVEKANEALAEIDNNIMDGRQSIDFADSSDYFQDEYAKRRDHPELYRGIMCGVDAIDKRTFGWLPGQMIVLLAPSSGGKSVQLLNWAHKAFQQGKNVLYFSFEMDAYECLTRHLSLNFKTSYAAIKGVMMETEEFESIVKKLTEFKDGPYFEYDVNMENPTAEYVDAKIRELINTKGKPDIVVVDYIGIMQSAKAGKDAKEWEQQAEVVKRLKILAKRYQLPILTAQQINRDAMREQRKMKESGKAAQFHQDAVAGTGKLIHFAHFAIGLEPDKENGMATYHPIKMRDAWFPPVGVRWNADQHLITPLTEDEDAEWRALRGLSESKPAGADAVPTERHAPRASASEDGMVVEVGNATNIFSNDDLELGGDLWEL
jgi:replicative DNA helicase